MKTENAIKKLKKLGFNIQQTHLSPSRYIATKNGKNDYISFLTQGDELSVIDLRTEGQEDDTMSDYHAGTFCNNLSQALRIGEF